MNEDILGAETISKTYRYRLAWIFLIVCFGTAGLGIWSYLLNGPPMLILFLFITLCLLAAYIEWKTFFLHLDETAIYFGSIFHKRAISYTNIKSIEHIFGKSSDFVVVKPITGKPLTIWMYLQDFNNVRLAIVKKGQQVGALIRERDKWGKWS